VVINQIIVKQTLEEWGHEVVIVPNGQEAVDQLKLQDFDLILMDIHMPEVDGYEATQMIRKLSNTAKAAIPIVALTANAFKNETDRFAEAGFNDYITKPFTEQKLFDCIQRLLNLHKPLQIIHPKKEPNKLFLEKSYDLSALQSMEIVDEGFIAEIADLFVKNTRIDLIALNKAVTEQNLNEIYQYSHRMKSSIYSLGIKDAYENIESMEFYAKTHEQIDKIPFLFEKLRQTLFLVFDELTIDFSL
jgi:CheY-like chemotaxis protein